MPFYIDPRVAHRTVAFWVEKCWLIRGRCQACGHIGELRAQQLRALPQGATIAQVVERLKCEACGGTEGYADWLQDLTATAVRDAEDYRRRTEEAAARVR